MTQILVSMTVGRQVPGRKDNVPVDGWGIEAPVGSRIVNVGQNGNDLAVVVLLNPNAPRVWLPLLIIPLGKAYKPLLGRKIGECFGIFVMGAVFALFADDPWPTSTIEAIKPEGAA